MQYAYGSVHTVVTLLLLGLVTTATASRRPGRRCAASAPVGDVTARWTGCHDNEWCHGEVCLKGLCRTQNYNESSSTVGKAVARPAHLSMTSLLLGLVIMATIVGNVFVMVAIGVERHLRVNVANYLIASLAVADLLVAALVMPLAAVNDVTQGWPLGSQLCDAWVSFDVLCCTSSILHLVAISLDRYWAVTRVDYIHNRSSFRYNK